MKSGDLVGSKYRLVTRLGQGGMGAVWSAQHVQTGREFAIKFLHAFVAQGSDDARHRFMQEARASARVNHPNIIDIFDVGETEDGTLYLVMELLDGMSLADAFRAEPAFTLREILVLMVGASHALGAAHAAGIVHRDVKPLNIYLHRDRNSNSVRPKVLDFGVSKVALGDDDGHTTQIGSLLGSPRYMAPEQAVSAAAADGRSDIWSLGVILYEALTGRFPHEGDSSNAIVIAIATRPPTPILEVIPTLPRALAQLVDACLKPVEQRIQRAETLAERLEEIVSTHELSELKVARPPGGRKSVKRPDNFIINTNMSLDAGQMSMSMSQRRASIVRQDLLAALPPPAAAEGEETEAATLMFDSSSGRPVDADQARGGSTIVLGTPSGLLRSPVAPQSIAPSSVAPPAPRASGDSTENVSSMTMGRLLSQPITPIGTPVLELPPAPRSKRVPIAIGGASLLLGALGIYWLSAGSSEDSAGPPSAVVTATTPAPSATAAPTATAVTATSAAAASASASASATATATTTVKTFPTFVQPSSKPKPTATVKPFDPLADPGFKKPR